MLQSRYPLFMNNPLVPQLRADKNGKLVTRHVKAKSGTDQKTDFPAPAMKVVHSEYESNLAALKSVIHESLETVDYGTEISRHRLEEELLKLAPSVAEAFHKQIVEKPDFGYEDILVSALHKKDDSSRAGYVLFITQQAVPEGGLDNGWDEDTECTFEYDEANKVMRGILQFCAKTGYKRPENIFESDDESRHKIQALTKFLKKGSRMENYGVSNDWQTNAIILNDMSLGHLVMDRPDEVDMILCLMEEDYEDESLTGDGIRAALEYYDEHGGDMDRIISVVKERKTSDVETISQVLNAETKSLSSGAL